MRYIGGKSKLNDFILNTIKTVNPKTKSIIDAFSGSGSVANYMKKNGYNVFCNDLLYFSFVIARGTIQLNKIPKFKKIENPIKYLNELELKDTNIDVKDCFIYQNYSPHENCNRMYFQPKNAIKIDIIRQTIEKWHIENKITDDEYYYLLSSLILSVPFVSNIAGVYAAYLKYWDARSYKDLTLKIPEIINNNVKAKAYNKNVDDLIATVEADVLYSDSPYNSREYLPNYHILETIAKYDNPVIKGITGMRDYSSQKSDFCSKKTVKTAFETMIMNAKVKHIIISYNNEGLISTEDLSNLCKKYAVDKTFELKRIPYRKYKSKNLSDSDELVEQLYVFEKKQFYKSPMNYTGGKYKLLSQIYPLFPTKIDTMVDLFCGGCDVSINTVANHIICNDINTFIIEIYKTFQRESIDNLLNRIHFIIDIYCLSKTNKAGYLKLRNDYNCNINNMRNPMALYVLLSYSFNHQIRFNSDYEFNSPFGKNRSEFNAKMESNLVNFCKSISAFDFNGLDFKKVNLSGLSLDSFVYADPPYRISIGSYNDGKRGFDCWSERNDKELCDILDNLNDKGVKFAMSNVLSHKGQINDVLTSWAKRYNIHHLSFNYDNSNYHAKNTELCTDEVLITNY